MSFVCVLGWCWARFVCLFALACFIIYVCCVGLVAGFLDCWFGRVLLVCVVCFLGWWLVCAVCLFGFACFVVVCVITCVWFVLGSYFCWSALICLCVWFDWVGGGLALFCLFVLGCFSDSAFLVLGWWLVCGLLVRARILWSVVCALGLWRV